MVSLGSVTMAALYPVLTILYGVFRGYSAADLTVCTIGSVIMAAMVIYMHRSNIQRIRDEGVTVILVEQNAKKSLSICNYAYVIETGHVVMSGTGEEMLRNPEVAAAYLGSTRT